MKNATEKKEGNTNCSRDPSNFSGRGMALGSGLGVAIGSGIGAATGDIGFWIGVGLPIGLAIGALLPQLKGHGKQNLK